MGYLQIIEPYYFGGGLDPDAEAFLIASDNMGDATIVTAINKLVIDLKEADLWSRMKAIYPFVGGTSFKHKWNLKDPRDLDEAFRIVEDGINTHNQYGITMNGVDGRLVTMLNMRNNLSTTNGHFSLYQRDNRPSRYAYDMGDAGIGIVTKYSDGLAYFMYNGGFSASLAVSDSRGLFMTNRDGSNTDGYKNGNRLISKSQTVSVLPGAYALIGATAIVAFSASNYALASIGGKFTISEASSFYSIVQEFQTTLGRQV